MRTLQQVIKHYSDQFQSKTRDNGETYVCAPDMEEELQEALYKAHGDRFPDDWIYSTFSHLLEKMQEYDCNDLNEFSDNYRSDIVDGEVDVYTYDLTKWLHSHISNVYYLTDVLEEFELKDGFQLLAMAQYKAIDEIYTEIFSLLEKAMSEEGK